MSEIVDWRPPQGLQNVVSGIGCVESRLSGALKAASVRAPMIVCGANLAVSPLVALTRKAAGMPLSLWDGSRPHTPIETVDAGIDAALKAGADSLIALGGSSTSDCAKGIAVLMASNGRSATELRPVDWTKMAAPMLEDGQRPIPVFVIPTTLSAAEFQTFFGMRDARTTRKEPYSERNLVRRTIFLDGAVAADTPAGVWRETAIKQLDDMLYRYCTAQEDPPLDAVLAYSIKVIFDDLASSLAAHAAESRQRLFRAMWLSNNPMPPLRPVGRQPWLSTVARHAIGGVTGLAHGIGSCVSLEASLRFHREVTGARQEQLAERLGFKRELVDAVHDLLADTQAPTKLEPLGVERALLDQILSNMHHEYPDLGDRDKMRSVVERFW